MKRIAEWSKAVDGRLNAIADVADPNSFISQLNGQFARHRNNLLYLYNTVLDPNDPNSLALRVEVLEDSQECWRDEEGILHLGSTRKVEVNQTADILSNVTGVKIGSTN